MTTQVKIRLQDLPADVEAAAAIIASTMPVLEESGDVPNRGKSKFVRRYLTVQVAVLESVIQEVVNERKDV